MGEILGLGMSHYPNLSGKGNMSRRMRLCIDDAGLDERLRSPQHWPPAAREQWGADEGQAHSDRHRQELIDNFRKIRAELDAFRPDFVLIWGDDQYENFREDCVPSFSVLAYESISFEPWRLFCSGANNAWGEPVDTVITVPGHRAGGKHVARALLEEGIDVAYAYRPLHHPLGHAFANSIMYLDYDRRGLPWPVVPFAVNAYGRWLVATRGSGVGLRPSEAISMLSGIDHFDPPAPQPWRCFQVGGAVVRALRASPWRVAVIASSSWSHSFLVRKTSMMFPDVASDRRYYEALKAGDWELWKHTRLEDIEDRGHQELLNWFCLAGAMCELGHRGPHESAFLESWITNSDKVFAVFRPRPSSA